MNHNRIEKLVFGGKGLMRHDGLVTFIEDVIEDEEVQFSVTQRKKTYQNAKLEQIISPSPDRVTPQCPHFGVCGGCQLQHIRYERQVAYKEAWLKESLERIAKVACDVPIRVYPAKSSYGYRKKIVLHAFKEGVGYFSRDLQPLKIGSCPIFEEGPTELFDRLQTLGIEEGVAISIFKEPAGGIAIHMRHSGPLSPGADEIYSNLCSYGYRVCIEGADRTIGALIAFDAALDGISYSFDPTVFVQNDPEQFAGVYRYVIDCIEKLCYQGPILELYSGIGVLSLLLAKRGYAVSAIEKNRQAVEHAKRSASKNGFENIHCIPAGVERLRAHVQPSKYGVWIANPPRIGLAEEVKKELLNVVPEHLIYISCEPTTLARDLKELSSAYRIESLALFDMFSQTTHFETVVCLKSLL